MWRSGVLTLISENPQAHGIFSTVTETKRTVFCEIRSVSYAEYYRALEQDLRPTFIFRLADYAEYQNEKICEFDGTRYRVIRTYVDNTAIELTVEEATVDMTPPPTPPATTEGVRAFG